jgi:hypothetical protein
MRWTREEYLSHMTFGESPREMFTELFGLLIGLDREWKSQGADEREISLEAFGWDYVPWAAAPFDVSPKSGIAPRVISETESEQVSIDSMGRKMRLSKKCATIPLPFSYPVQTPQDWENVKKWYSFDISRLDREALKRLKAARAKGALVNVWMPGGFDEPRNLMGEAELCCAYYDEPEMIRDMLDTFGELCLKGIEVIANETDIDVLCVHEDMAGASGPMIGPKLFKSFISPYYARVWDRAKQAGARLFSQDSDGDINPILDEIVAAGINCVYPLEPKAGMDMLKLREKYGTKLAFKGGIDKFALRGTADDVKRELDYKLRAPLTGGGTVFALDHRIPNGVPIENYRLYVNYGREKLGLPPAEPEKHVRMAF